MKVFRFFFSVTGRNKELKKLAQELVERVCVCVTKKARNFEREQERSGHFPHMTLSGELTGLQGVWLVFFLARGMPDLPLTRGGRFCDAKKKGHDAETSCDHTLLRLTYIKLLSRNSRVEFLNS